MSECLPDLPRYVRQRGNEWQGANHPDGPWRPIPAPQSGLPWPADGPAVPESREPAAVIGEPSDEELKATYWEAYRETAMCGAEASWLAGLRAVAGLGLPTTTPAGQEGA